MRQRLVATYGFNFTDLSRFGLVVFTDLLGEAEVVATILTHLSLNRSYSSMSLTCHQ
jgi:hypothetical protein